jgi:uncharacterized protein (TIGR03437 family)
LAVAQDQFGNLVIADASNRIGVYVPQVQALNAFNLLPTRPLAPGMIASLCSPGSECDPRTTVQMFGSQTQSGSLPLPPQLADIQVTLNSQPVPLYYVSPGQINFVVPMSAPISGTANLEVVQPSTGRILAAGQPTMAPVSPAIATGYESGQLQQSGVINADNSINTVTNGAARGTYVSIFGTGQGPVSNPPPDGAAVQGSYPAIAGNPGVFIQGLDITQQPAEAGDPPKDQWIQYSGLSGYPGLWQINVFIPHAIAPGSQNILTIVLGGVPNYDPNGNGTCPAPPGSPPSTCHHRTTIAIK